MGRGRRGTADHDLSTAGGHQLVPQCALSQGMEGLGLCQAGGGQVSSEAAGLPPNARPPVTGSYLIQGHFVTGEEPIYYQAVCEATPSAFPEPHSAAEPAARPARAGEVGAEAATSRLTTGEQEARVAQLLRRLTAGPKSFTTTGWKAKPKEIHGGVKQTFPRCCLLN